MGILNRHKENIQVAKSNIARLQDREKELVEGIIKEVYYGDIVHSVEIETRVYTAAVCYLFNTIPYFSMRKDSISSVTQSGNNPLVYCCYVYKYYETESGCWPVNISELENIWDLVDTKEIWRVMVAKKNLSIGYHEWIEDAKRIYKPLAFYEFIVELDIYGDRINLITNKELGIKNVLVLLPERCQYEL